MSPIRKLLVANRGEIAVRIIRTCREMGISPVAVFSEADRYALHVSLADEAVYIGDSAATESYLNTANLIGAARQTGADALHPGVGFLSENAEFAAAVMAEGLRFVGPPPEVIEALGDKSSAKRRMAEAGVPVVPGYWGDDQTDATLLHHAGEIGTPLLIKAAGGGGGRGMRVVRTLAEFPERLDEARREALAAFHDDRVLLERYVERPRHIEFQVFGDGQGNVCHLFERECSIQRRYQKIVEESPSPALTPELREQIAEAAVRAAGAAGYVNAGTVEFLLESPPEGTPRFYFLEVNTRLQVEHPVTEAVTGLDLVRLQLNIAAGAPLPFTQEQLSVRGHAIEARIYAEDARFLPSIGPIVQWNEPRGPGVRVDSGCERGGEVSSYYDPMLAKLIVSAEDRPAAISRLQRALSEFDVLDVETNIAYLRAITDHPAFRSGHTDTAFLADYFADWRPSQEPSEEALLALAACSTLAPGRAASTLRAPEQHNPWQTAGGWRNS